MQRIVLGTLAFVLIACGGDEAPPSWNGSLTTSATGASGPGPSSSSSAGAGGQNNTGWDVLIDADWEVKSGDEAYLCTRKTLGNDTYVTGFRALSPVGTHHTIAATEQNSGVEDGTYSCNSADIGHTMIFVSGVGTNDLVFPKGIAAFIPAGTQILLNLHLFNTTPDLMTGISGTLVQTIEASEVTDVAEVVLAGTLSLVIGPQATAKIQGNCTFDDDATILSVWPHMHQYGTHMKVTHLGAVLHDGPYDFNEQTAYEINSVVVKKGETVTVECSYQNTSNNTITFGESSEAEMCFAGLYHYPAIGQPTLCPD